MVQVLDANPSFAQQFGRQMGRNVGSAGVGALEGFMEKQRKQEMLNQLAQENKALQGHGIELSGITNPKTREQVIAEGLKGQSSQRKEYQDKMIPAKAALSTIAEMRNLGKTGHLGPKISQGFLGTGLANEDVRRNRSKYEQLGKSLISMASTIPIRNQAEFNTLSERLYDPTLTDATREGILDALENVIKRGLGEEGESLSFSDQIRREPSGKNQSKVDRPSLLTFHR